MFRIRCVKVRDIFKSVILSESAASTYAPLSAVTPLQPFPCTCMVVTENVKIHMFLRAVQIKLIYVSDNAAIEKYPCHLRILWILAKLIPLYAITACRACLSYAPQEAVKGREIWWHRKPGSWNKKCRTYEGLVFARGGSKPEVSFVRSDTMQ